MLRTLGALILTQYHIQFGRKIADIYSMAKEIEITLEKHPDWYIDVPGMRTLILGSFPPHENKRDYEFYYPNKQNRFWKVLAKADKYSLKYFEGKSAVDERDGY